ncbi:unnamed protein product [marine sediment metagenome]|uniref:SMODS and SLOG-associating 2TM effector domain-containing protein n=1 Tax=marine sediment metagenome TaxID=412755 RepID=X0UFR7_9ZZZZ
MQLRTAIRNSMLTADLNVRYWGYISRRYYKTAMTMKIFLVIMASGTVASWGIWQEIELLWKILSGIAAILSIILPILRTEEKIDKTSFLKGKWIEVKNDYEFLWDTKENKNLNGLTQEYKRIRDKETKVSKKEKNLPYRSMLIAKCYKEVLKSRGL